MRKKELTLGEMAVAALRKAVARVVEEHRKQGLPLATWKDGKVVMAPPPKLRKKRRRKSKQGTSGA